MQYRLLAELIRQLKFLIPVGGGRPPPRAPIYLAGEGDAAPSWVGWHLRAIARDVGLPQAKAEPRYLADCLTDLAAVAGERGQEDGGAAVRSTGQYRFHRHSAGRLKRIHHFLHGWSSWLFVATIGVILIHLGLHALETTVRVDERLSAAGHWLVLLSAFLPALGAALAGIDHHGEFAQLSRRYDSMAQVFELFAKRLGALQARLQRADRVRLAEVTYLASSMAEAMVGEVTDWRVVVLDPPQAT
jgi:hypothetical protein